MAEALIALTDGQKTSADDSVGARQLSVNWLVDSNETARPRFGIVNTDFDPGTYANTAGTNVGVIGMYVWRSTFNQREYLVYVRQDRTIWAKDMVTLITSPLSSGTVSTYLDGSASQVTFAEDSQRLTMAGGGQLQTWNGNPANVSARIAAFVVGVNQPPVSATHVVGLANYLVANQNALPGSNNQIFWSNLGDGNHTTWNPLNFNTADADPDAIVSLGVNLREVFAFGTKTIQTFGIGSDPLLPFTAAASMALGCGAAYSPIPIDGGAFALLDNTRRFVTTDGRTMNHISKDIDKAVRDYSSVSDCFGFRLRMAYWDLLVWVFPTAKRTQVYDLTRQKWYPVRGWNNVDDYDAIRIGAYAFWQTGNMHLVGDPLYENLWTLNADAISDTGPVLPIISTIVTQRLDQGTAEYKRTKHVRFFLRRGQTAGAPAATLDVAKRDDDGPWSSTQQLDLGVAGDYRSFVDWFPGGIYRRRQYRVRYSGAATTSIARMVEFFDVYGA